MALITEEHALLKAHQMSIAVSPVIDRLCAPGEGQGVGWAGLGCGLGGTGSLGAVEVQLALNASTTGCGVGTSRALQKQQAAKGC